MNGAYLEHILDDFPSVPVSFVLSFLTGSEQRSDVVFESEVRVKYW